MKHRILNELFSETKIMIGMVHLTPLPGSPGFQAPFEEGVWSAVQDALTLEKAGFDAVIVENFNDVPYDPVPNSANRTVAMAVATSAVKNALSIPVGVNVHWNDYEAECALAAWTGGRFIRVEAFVDCVVHESGLTPGCAYKVMRQIATLPDQYRPFVLADIQVKETEPFVDVALPKTAQRAEKAGASAIIVSGDGTGQPAPLEDTRSVKEASDLPVIVGSGVNVGTIRDVLDIADGAIVGTATKRDGVVSNPVDLELSRQLMSMVRHIPHV